MSYLTQWSFDPFVIVVTIVVASNEVDGSPRLVYEERTTASGAKTATVHRSPAAIAVFLEVRSEAMSRCTRPFTPCEASAKAQLGGTAEVDRATSADAKAEGACRRAA